MQFTVKDVRLESQIEGPDMVKIRLTTPTGAAVDLVQDVPRESGEKWLREHFGSCEYRYFEVRSGGPRKPPRIVDELRKL